MRTSLVLVAVAACGHPPAASHDASATDGPRTGDAPVVHDAPPMTPDGGTYRTSLSVCWTDATCTRVLALAHGGAWDAATVPYDSNAAIAAAYADGDDGVKIDVRVTKDNIPVIAHSSPIQIYESLDCANQRIEDMTAAQVTACHRFPSSTETFQRLDDVLGYIRGKMVVQLCVKQVTDFARTIAEVHTLGAEDFAFLEINAGDVASVTPVLPGSDSVFYLVNLASDLTPVDGLLALHDERLFMFEIDPGVDIGTLVPSKLHPAGVRSFIYDSAAAPTVDQLKAHYEAGFDAVSSQSGPNGVAARQAVNSANGITPP
jgi:glycerophosphoryl diester phosphodiesterase family protein